VWLLYRYRNYQHWLIGRVYWLLNAVLEQIVPDVQLLTDSELLSTSLAHTFGKSVSVVPIPHAAIPRTEPFSKRVDERVFWWPGLPGIHKGWDVIRHLASSRYSQHIPLRLVAAKSSLLEATPGGPDIALVEDILTREAYVRWFATSDLILLPYDADVYREQTSGIFTECVCAGKLPAVMGGTWMAYELHKYNLQELIVDWHSDALIDKLLSLVEDQNTAHKLAVMQQAYRSFHSIASYASCMKRLSRSSFSSSEGRL
jgi:hypothetical protein